jgi:hypothetical protein
MIHTTLTIAATKQY